MSSPTQALPAANPDAQASYEFGGEIARGGMGSILEAADCKLGRTVAVKIMLSTMETDEQQKQRFINEAAVLATLEHPNIVPIHDLGRDEKGRLYYTMKLVQGHTLQAILNALRNGEPTTTSHYTLDRLLTIFRKVCDALAFAHSRGIIHRDLKPENIMVGEFGEVLVMDWGLAKDLNAAPLNGGTSVPEIKPSASDQDLEATLVSNASDSMRRAALAQAGDGSRFDMTLEGDVMGTPQYMSPEQAMGKVNEMDARSDVFSLGGILYCILTLCPPVEGNDVWEVLEKVRTGKLTAPAAFGASTASGEPKVKGTVADGQQIKPLPHCPGGRVPPALSAVAMKALKLDKARRYQSVAAISADIEKYQGGFATSAENAGFAKQIALLIKRNKGIFTTAAAAWFIVTGLVVWFVVNLRKEERRAVAGEKSAKVAEAVAVQEKEAARQSAVKANLALADAAMRKGDSSVMRAALDAVPDELRDSTWSYLLDQSDSSMASFPMSEGVAADPSRPGVFAIAAEGTKVTIVDVPSGKSLLEFERGFATKARGGPYTRLAFSPDGQRIAIGRRHGPGIVIHDTHDGRKLLEWDADPSRQLAFSADGKLLLQHAEGTDGKRVVMWDSATGAQCWKYEGDNCFGAFTADGKNVVTLGGKDSLRLVNAKDGTLVRPILDRPRPEENVPASGTQGLSVGGELVAVSSSGNRVFVVNWALGRLLTRIPHERPPEYLAWTPDSGQLITAVLERDGRQIIRLWNPSTGQIVRSILGGSREVHDLVVHPLSGEMFIAGPAGRAWRIASAPPKWTLPISVFGRIAFWGSDDVVIAPASSGKLAVQKLIPAGISKLWEPEYSLYRAETSADGRWAVFFTPNKAFPSLLLRRKGDQVEQVAALKSGIAPNRVRFSPEGDRVLVGGGGSPIELLAIPRSEPKGKLDRSGVNTINDLGWVNGGQSIVGLATAKGQRLAPESEERVILWEAATGKVLRTATHPTAMDVLAVAPDGTRFAEAGADERVRIRDARTLGVLHEFRAHEGPITALAWHPTRAVLATGSADLSVKLWDLDTGRRLEELRGHTKSPGLLVFSPSGRYLASSSGNAAGNNRIWEPASLREPKNTAAGPDAEGWSDLLAQLTAELVARAGHDWRMDGGALYSPRGYTAMPLPGQLAGASYRLRLKLRRFSGDMGFHLALPVGDHRVEFSLDAFRSKGFGTGFGKVNGKGDMDRGDVRKGRQVQDDGAHTLEVSVTLEGENAKLAATLDEQPLIEYTGSIAGLSLDGNFPPTPPGTLALASHGTGWVVQEVKVKRSEK